MMLDELFEKSWAFQEMRQKAYEQGCKEAIRQDLPLVIQRYPSVQRKRLDRR